MIDYFALALTHALLLIALLRLVRRKDVDREEDKAEVNARPASGDVDGPRDSSDIQRERRGPRARRRA